MKKTKYNLDDAKVTIGGVEVKEADEIIYKPEYARVDIKTNLMGFACLRNALLAGNVDSEIVKDILGYKILDHISDEEGFVILDRVKEVNKLFEKDGSQE